jgi:hypothetical protein
MRNVDDAAVAVVADGGPSCDRRADSKRVSPGAWGGSWSGAGRRWRAPKPRTQPRAPDPPQ